MYSLSTYGFRVGSITSLGKGIQSHAINSRCGQIIKQHRCGSGIECHVGQHLHGIASTDLNLVAIQIAIVMLRRWSCPAYPTCCQVVHANLYVIRRSRGH